MNSGFSQGAIRVRYPNLLLERGLFYSELDNTFIKKTCYINSHQNELQYTTQSYGRTKTLLQQK